MRLLVALLFCLLPAMSVGQGAFDNLFKFSTLYAAANGNNSLATTEAYSIDGNTVLYEQIETPFDYSLTLGIRKIARFGYENRANVFYDGTEKTYGDDATIGKRQGLEFLAEVDYRRQQGISRVNQHHFLRYVANRWLAKVEYLEDGFADVGYTEASQRLRLNSKGKISFNIGIAQRISEAYGYDPISEWVEANNSIHYTSLALDQGYTVDFATQEFLAPDGTVVANSIDVWREVVIPQVLSDYVSQKRNELPAQWCHSAVIGFDYYQNSKDLWIHSWTNFYPIHLATDNPYSYNTLVGTNQWLDMSIGLISGWKITRSLGIFGEGTFHRYWNRQWHMFSVGVNYVIY